MRKQQPKSPREFFFLNINPAIRFLILSDIIWGGAVGFLGPIFALFIVGFIDGGSPAVARNVSMP
ncbi:MAG: hypothetical protein WDZ90_01625 [Candidatus Paceibacterota bacterium]